MKFFSKTTKLFTAKYLRRVDRFRQHPRLVQEEQLSYLLDHLHRTVYGNKYTKTRLASYGEFARRVPVATYEDLEPYIMRMRRGGRNVLWPGRTQWFARSSGTSNSRSKYIPVTPECLENCHYRGGRDVLSHYIEAVPDTRFYLGKGLTLGGSHQIEASSRASKEGDLSAILLQNIPKWADFIRTPSREVALLDDWEQKLEGIAHQALSQNVTSLTGVPSWNMVMIKFLLERTGRSNLSEIWPGLEVFFHGGVSFAPYRAQYQALIPSARMHYMETYNASEGFFAVQDDMQRSDMLLCLDYGVFYEFIDMERMHEPHPPVIPLWEVERGRNYAMLISSTNGLFRYLIGDTVTFTETKPYRIRITGRTKHFINAFGEELIIDNAERALQMACRATGAIVEEYTAGPRFMDAHAKGSHEWYVEFARPPRSLQRFADLLDLNLRQENSDYDAKRAHDVTLTQLILHPLPKGTFLGWMAENGKSGGQNKVPRLYNDRTHLESIERYLEHRRQSNA